MKLRWALLCDHFANITGGKAALVGTFDTFFCAPDRNSWEPIRMPLANIVAAVAVGFSDPRDLVGTFELRDADYKIVGSWKVGPLKCPDAPAGHEVIAHLHLFLLGATIPDAGDYTWRVLVNGEQVGEVPMFVRPAPPPAVPAA